MIHLALSRAVHPASLPRSSTQLTGKACCSPASFEEQGKLLGVWCAYSVWGTWGYFMAPCWTDPLLLRFPTCRPHLTGSVPAESVLPGAAVANPDLGERTFLTYLTVKAHVSWGHPLRQLAGEASGCWEHSSGVVQRETSRTCGQALFPDSVPGACKACHSSGHLALGCQRWYRAVPSTAVSLLVWHMSHSSGSHCWQLMRCPQCCTSPAPLNYQSSKAFWGGAASCQVLTKSQAPSPSDVPLHSCTSDSWHLTPW